MSEENSFLVFAGTKTRYLAEKICASLGCPLGNLVVTRFSDGEFAVSYEESIRGRDVFLVQSTFPNSDNLMELLLMIDAAKRASARQIIAVIPYFGWALGTFLGAVLGNILPDSIMSALGLALYGMFIAIVVPVMKEERPVIGAVVIAAILSVMFTYVPVMNKVSSGIAISICAIVSAGIMAFLKPVADEPDINDNGGEA